LAIPWPNDLISHYSHARIKLSLISTFLIERERTSGRSHHDDSGLSFSQFLIIIISSTENDTTELYYNSRGFSAEYSTTEVTVDTFYSARVIIVGASGSYLDDIVKISCVSHMSQREHKLQKPPCRTRCAEEECECHRLYPLYYHRFTSNYLLFSLSLSLSRLMWRTFQTAISHRKDADSNSRGDRTLVGIHKNRTSIFGRTTRGGEGRSLTRSESRYVLIKAWSRE